MLMLLMVLVAYAHAYDGVVVGGLCLLLTKLFIFSLSSKDSWQRSHELIKLHLQLFS